MATLIPTIAACFISINGGPIFNANHVLHVFEYRDKSSQIRFVNSELWVIYGKTPELVVAEIKEKCEDA